MPQKRKLKTISPEDASISNYLMQKNLNKNFVQRAYDPNRQSIQIPGESGKSTHFMEWSFSPDQSSARVYPTVIDKGNKLEYVGSDANSYANNTGEYINVPMNKAQMFSEYGYKHASNIPIYKDGGIMKKMIKIVGTPRFDTGGQWAEQRGSARQGYALYTPWPISAYQQTVQDPNYQMKSTLQPVPRELSDIEAEKGEHILGDFNQDGLPESMGIGGKRHSEGGTPLAVPDGSFIFSDTKKLKIKDPIALQVFNASKPMTPGKLAKKYPLNEHKAAMDNPDTPPMERKTHEMMYNNNLKKLQQLSQYQELLKASKGIPASPQQSTMWSGGNVDGSKRNYDDYQDTGDSRQVTNREYMKPNTTSGKKRIQVVGTPTVQLPYRFDLNPTAKENAVPSIPGITPTPGNMQQGLNEPTLGNVPVTGTDPNPTPDMSYRPMSVDMSTMGEFVPKIPRGTNKFNKMLAGAKDALGNYRGLSADAMGDIALGLKALNTRKYSPWEAPVQVTYPELYLESDQPVRNALSEVSNTIQQGMYSGDPKAGRSAANAGQGQLLAQAAQAVGQISNRNAVRATDYSNVISGINNEKLAQQRERANRLYQGNVIAAQQYQNSLNNLMDEGVARAMAKEQKASERAWMNKTSPYFNVDNRGMPYLKPGVTDAQIEKMIQERGGGARETATYKQWYDHYKNMEMDDDDAKRAAFKKVTDMDKEPKVINKNSKKTGSGTSSTTVVKRYGGMLSYLR